MQDHDPETEPGSSTSLNQKDATGQSVGPNAVVADQDTNPNSNLTDTAKDQASQQETEASTLSNVPLETSETPDAKESSIPANSSQHHGQRSNSPKSMSDENRVPPPDVMQDIQPSTTTQVEHDPEPTMPATDVPKVNTLGPADRRGQHPQPPFGNAYPIPVSIYYPTNPAIGYSHPHFPPTPPAVAQGTYPGNEPQTTAAWIGGKLSSVFSRESTFQQPASGNSHSNAAYDDLRRRYNDLAHQLEGYKERKRSDASKIKQLEQSISLQTKEVEASRGKMVAMEAQVKELRSQIYSMATGRGTANDDDHYARNFIELKYLIETEMLKLSRAHNGHVLSDDVPDMVFEKLMALGETGENCRKVLASKEYSIPFLYSQGIWRHALLRHVVALFLFERVFQPFAFGLPPAVSIAFQVVDSNILANETQFSNILTIHQANGRAANLLAKNGADSYQREIEGELAGVLNFLLPLTDHLLLAEKVMNIVDKAVALKREMTQEYGLYYCRWVPYGMDYYESAMEANDEDDKGFVAMCIFPRLIRKVKGDQGTQRFTVVKARTMLQSTFNFGSQG